MKAILFINKEYFGIENWFEVEECKKIMLETIPKNSTIVVDNNLFENLSRLNLTKNFNVVVFDINDVLACHKHNILKTPLNKKEFNNAIKCYNYNSLAKQLLDYEKNGSETFLLPSNSSSKKDLSYNDSITSFKKLLNYCDSMTIAKFDFDQKFPLAQFPNSGYWIQPSTLEPIKKDGCVIVEKKNMQPMSYSFMQVEDTFVVENILNQQNALNQPSQKTTQKQDKTKIFLEKLVSSKNVEKAKEQHKETQASQTIKKMQTTIFAKMKPYTAQKSNAKPKSDELTKQN